MDPFDTLMYLLFIQDEMFNSIIILSSELIFFSLITLKGSTQSDRRMIHDMYSHGCIFMGI